MNKNIFKILLVLPVVLLPMVSRADGAAESLHGMRSVLDHVKDEMMPMCEKLIGVGKGIGAFGALWYIAYRVWRHIANAEPVDFYPLLRPFAIGLCIIMFNSGFIPALEGVLNPIVAGTEEMLTDSNKAVEVLLKQKEDAIKGTKAWQMYIGLDNEGNQDEWYRFTHDDANPEDQNIFESIGSDVKFAFSKMSYKVRSQIKEWMSEILRILFEAAALCINTMRIFQLIVLAILGPLAFGISIFDGFQQTLTTWLAKYINIFLWLPVCNVFGAIIGKIQEDMLKIDLGQIAQNGDTFFSANDTAYLIFLVIGILGYASVPSVASFIVNSGSNAAIMSSATKIVSTAGSMAGSAAGAGIGMAGSGIASAGKAAWNTLGAMENAAAYYHEGLQGKEGAGGSGIIGKAMGHYMASKLSGKTDDKKTKTDS